MKLAGKTISCTCGAPIVALKLLLMGIPSISREVVKLSEPIGGLGLSERILKLKVLKRHIQDPENCKSQGLMFLKGD